MLCDPAAVRIAEVTRDGTVGVSAGTAAVVGLHPIRQADAPPTAYLMMGERCRYDCAFCTQARSSAARMIRGTSPGSRPRR